MIKANELRIGNWVRHEEFKTFHRVKGFTPDRYFYTDLQRAYSDLVDFEPVILTPEILIKSEFEKDGRYWHHKKFVFFCLVESKYDKNDLVFYFSNHGVMNKIIDFVHELQNIFILTGEELEINL